MSSSNNRPSPMEEGTSQNADTEKPSPRLQTNRNDQIITPPPSNLEPSDYSDTPSVDSPQQRRHKRGGRKTKDKAERLQSVSEFDVPTSRTSERDELSGSVEMHEDSKSEDYDADKLEEARSSRASGSKQPSHNRAPKADTAIRAFNLKKAESSGGRSPFGITIDSPKPKTRAHKQTTRESPEKHSQEDQQDEKQDEQDDEMEKKRRFSIRFDLNLEIEIFLKAKIKGDITMTFLE